MNLFGWSLTRAPKQKSVSGSGGWLPMWPIVREPYTGAWQAGDPLTAQTLLTFHAVYACVTLIAQDIAKMRVRLVELTQGVWAETESAAFSPVLRKPNSYQNRISFFLWWIVSKLLHGNAYVLKQRDARGVVVGLHVLDPTKVRVLIAPDGSVFYQLSADNLTRVTESNTVPAREIIHDVMCPLYHPLCGVSPLTASGMAAMQGLKIQENSTNFFANGSNPGGVLTAPGAISTEAATRVKTYWDAGFTGDKAGKVAVLGDGLKYEALTVNANDAQLIEQLQWTAETVCSTFHVPPYMVGVGEMPNYNNIEALSAAYYAQCLQMLIESLELCLDEGLELAGRKIDGKTLGVEFDIDDLLRMDTATLIKAEKDAQGIKKVNESRKRLNLPPVAGGDTVYRQNQDYSIEALNRRDQAQPAPDAASDSRIVPPKDDEMKHIDAGEFAGLLMKQVA